MMNYYNPYNPYNQLIAQQLANQQQQQAQMQQQQNQPMRVILISNDDEVKAIPADYNGNPTFFYNKSGNKIFIKQVNPQTMEARIQTFNAEPLPDSNIKTQPDEMMKFHEQHYNTVIEGINGIYRMLAPLMQNNISTQPPIMDDIKPKGKVSAKNSD